MRERTPRASEEPNPFLAARREFTSVFMDQARARRNWQLCAQGLLLLLAALLAAYIRLASETRITPYVVEVDRFGQALAFGPAERLRPTDGRLFTYQLAVFIRSLRTVTSDFAAQRELLDAGYAFAAGPARVALDAWFLDPAHDPRLLGSRLTRQIEVTAVLPLPRSRTWKVSWRETERPLSPGSPGQVRSAAWEAFLAVEHEPPTTTAGILRNPLGIYVTDLSWSEVAQGENR